MNHPQPEDILERARERIAERRAGERAASGAGDPRRDRRWALIFALLLAGGLIALLLWPGQTLQWKLFALVHGLIAQKHLVYLGELALPVCARNLGIYGAFLITLGYLFASGRGRAAALPPPALLIALGLGAATMVFDGVNSLLEDTGRAYLYPPRNDLRTISGALFGIALTPILLYVFNRGLRADPEPARPVLDWPGFAALLALNGSYVILVHSGMGLLYWPLAFFGVIGLLGEVFVVFLMLTAVGMGYTRRVTRLIQLARPACVALIPTALFVGGLAWVRFGG
jgi:hypothetical protein